MLYGDGQERVTFFLTKYTFYSTLLPADAENKNRREPKDGYSVEHSSVGTPLVFLGTVSQDSRFRFFS